MNKTEANFKPLTPLHFLDRAAAVYPNHIAVIHGERRYDYAELYRRSRKLASALRGRGVERGDTVSIIAPNTPAILEAHYGVPMAGAVLNPINTRLDPDTVAFILEHGEAKVLLTDRELSPTVAKALASVEKKPIVIDIDDPLGSGGDLLGETDYEAFLEEGSSELGEKETYRISQFMNVLTIVSVIVLPLSLITGFYGMNFQAYMPAGDVVNPYNMPELYTPFGYFGAIGIMALIALGQVLYFRRLGFLGRGKRR